MIRPPQGPPPFRVIVPQDGGGLRPPACPPPSSALRFSFLNVHDFVCLAVAGADGGDRLQGEAGLHRHGRHHGAQLPLL